MRLARAVLCVAAGACALLGAKAARAQSSEPAPAAVIETCLAKSGEARACVGAFFTPCLTWPDRTTTMGVASCYMDEGAVWDAHLNADYQRIMAALEPEQQTVMRDAQRAWIAFRDAHCDAFTDVLINGTGRADWGARCWAETTANRVGDFRRILSFVDP